MATRYEKQSVLKALENYKKTYGYKVVTKDNQLICYAGEQYKTLVFTETEDGKAYTQRASNELPKKYRELFNVKNTNKAIIISNIQKRISKSFFSCSLYKFA